MPDYVIYCDESCHNGNSNHNFMAIGGLWVPRAKKTFYKTELRKLYRSQGLESEIKWSKTSFKYLDAYKKIVDFFCDSQDLAFRVIVVDHREVDYKKYHGNDKELGFYKFYYEMLHHWLTAGNQYLVLLDYKTNKGADRYTTLKRILENKIRGSAWIIDLTIINSKESPLAQLTDLLTGAVAASYNKSRENSSKEALGQYIAGRLGFPSLETSTLPSEKKFNIFRIDLS